MANDALNSLKNKQQYHQEQLRKVTQAIEIIEKLKFRVGQVAFHKRDGAVIVKDIVCSYLGENLFDARISHLLDQIPEGEEVAYWVTGVEGDAVCAESDLVEYNEVSKTLYEKK